MRTRPTHVTLAVILQVREDRLSALLWERAREPFAEPVGAPGGYLGERETLEHSIRRQLAQKVDVREVAHLEQLETRSDPDRHPSEWQLATAYLGLVPTVADPSVPEDTAWHPVDDLPPMAFDHESITLSGGSGCARSSRTRTSASRSRPRRSRSRSCARSTRPRSATPCRRPICSACCSGARVLEQTGDQRRPGRAGGRPAAVFRFRSRGLEVTDPSAVLRPPA